MRLLPFGIVAAIGLAACSTAVTPTSSNDDSSSSRGSSAVGSSGANGSSANNGSSGGTSGTNGSSSSFSALPDVDSSLISGPQDLRVSTIANDSTIVLAWTDIPSLERDQYDGYKVFRSINYGSWDSVGYAEPLQQFFKDETIDRDGQYKYLYRIAAYIKKVSGGDSIISKYSNQVGTLPITTLGFGGVVFDEASNFSGVRWTPSKYELSWSHSGLKPEAGFVVQYMNCESDSAVEYVIDTDSSQTTRTCEAVWTNLDTLGESDNHFYVYGANSKGRYRIYAFYSDEFGNVISEFTPEITTATLAYDASIIFTAPDVAVRVDSALLTTGILPTHNSKVELVNKNGIVDTTYYEVQRWLGQNPVVETTLQLNQIVVSNAGTTNQCQFLVRARIRWIDQWGVSDVTEWSAPKGTLNSTASDPKKICTE